MFLWFMLFCGLGFHIRVQVLGAVQGIIFLGLMCLRV